jgi:acyl-CoA thioester hydrolase
MSQELKSKKNRKRSDYGFHQEYQTRWYELISFNSAITTKLHSRSDNDVYYHMNNSVYFHMFDSIINGYLMEQCGLTLPPGAHIGFVVHSFCDFFGSVAFPAVLDLGMRVTKLGKTSVAYEVGVFEKGDESVRAVGGFVHVFVEREGMRPAKDGMSDKMRNGLEKLLVQSRPDAKAKGSKL